MQLPNASKITKAQNELSEILDTSIKHLDSELNSFLRIIEPKIGYLKKEIANSVQEIVELGKTYEAVKKEVESFEEQKKDFLEFKGKLDKKATELDKQETDLLALHKVLENKRLIIQAQENELAEKKRRSGV